MAILVKELFITDLDPNSLDWWSADKVDKINLNFKQFVDGGQIGPQGAQGAYGIPGFSGSQGPQGPQGFIGAQGHQGEEGESAWIFSYEEGVSRSAYIFPRVKSSIGENHAITMRIGEDGDLSNPTWYGEYLENSVYTNVLTINNRSTGWNQITLSDDTNGIFKTGSYKFIYSNGKHVTKIGDFDNSGSFELEYDLNGSKVIKTLDYGSLLNTKDSINFSQNLLSFGNKTVITESVSSINTTYNPNSSLSATEIEGNILIPTNSSGDLIWAKKGGVFSTFPIGSIIQIEEDEFFNSDNFFMNESVPHDDDLLNVRYGRGKEDSQYSGWYLCNGETWTSPNGVITHSVPNLNSFNYSIGGDGTLTGQQPTPGGDNTKIIIGGYNTGLDCTYINGQYNNTSSTTEDTSDVNILLDSTDNGNQVTLKNNISIVYLQELDFTWSTGVSVAPTLFNITLTSPNGSSDDACSDSIDTTYKITTTSSTWTLFPAATSQYQLYNSTGTAPASQGWYQREGVSRYWNGSSWTAMVECNTQVNLYHDTNGINLNGTGSFDYAFTPSVTLSSKLINANSFASATLLYNSDGTLASAGWYRRQGVEGTPGIWLTEERRFWTGTQFSGETIFHNYIYANQSLGNSFKYSYTGGTSACATTNKHVTYILSNNSLTIFSNLSAIAGKIPYIHVSGSGTNVGEHPIIRVIDYAATGGNTYSKIADSYIGTQLNPAKNGGIDQINGKISTLLLNCPY